ncbi:4'-phosphopantetheinyl transferase family protein [Kitasatospora azatica]|uniref:4'-phosphopantetheinyl transferase family protein n=1 Tax=Kitasatospora azatica TaxID=58347 RepID=UPI0007C828A8|nr:4'-phosphopantetheinyl transferase superfamily protein [Kitasatospora azatica]
MAPEAAGAADAVAAVEPGEVRVWRVAVAPGNAAAARAAAPVLLDRAERARAAAFRREQDRQLYEVAHVGLRTVLAERLGRRPAELTFRQAPCPGCGEPHGRPEVDGPVEFSLSHAAGLAVIALAADPLGVDVEGHGAFEREAGEDVAGLLHPAERAELAAVEPERWAAAALRCWVRKEAYLKGTGMGLGRGVGIDYVGVGPEFLPEGGKAAGVEPAGWELHAVEVPEGYDAAVAVRVAEREAVQGAAVRAVPGVTGGVRLSVRDLVLG